ncbi:MAG: hypothetical protein DRO88_13425 [Promethearchaeia archaeon]|nr:MAG: hypothetical protein DRO88_13425 [Candidatus Lokiarchaeia archaeon]
MMISTNLQPLCIKYPMKNQIPRNLIGTPLEKEFKTTSKRIPFREQYANETRPHIIRHIHYQYGQIKRKRAVMYYYNQVRKRLIYANDNDKFLTNLMKNFPPKMKFPPNTASSPIARSLREMALKWIVEEFFTTLNYLTFDEPRLEQVNPDCLLLPVNEANKILHVSGKKSEKFPNQTEIESERALFVEIKAYHGSTKVGEKEVLQTFNYSNKGGKALLITTGALDSLESLEFLNNNSLSGTSEEKTYDDEVFADFTKQVKQKNRKYAKQIDMSISQDSFDTRGIYLSAHKKLQKMYRYTKEWPEEIKYHVLNAPSAIMDFLESNEKLGLVEPDAFHLLLQEKNLPHAADLFDRIRSSYLEEIIIDPPRLYPVLHEN